MVMLNGWVKVSRKTIEGLLKEPSTLCLLLYLQSRVSLQNNQYETSWRQIERDTGQARRPAKRRLDLLFRIGVKYIGDRQGIVVDLSDYMSGVDLGSTTAPAVPQPHPCGSTTAPEMVDCGSTTAPPAVPQPHPCGSTTALPPEYLNDISTLPLSKKIKNYEKNNLNQEGEGDSRAYARVKEENTPPLLGTFKSFPEEEWGEDGLTASEREMISKGDLAIVMPLNSNRKEPPEAPNDPVVVWVGLIAQNAPKSIYGVSQITNLAKRAAEEMKIEPGELADMLEYTMKEGTPWLLEKFWREPDLIFSMDQNGVTPLAEALYKYRHPRPSRRKNSC